jgi:hypothetical protein
MGLCAVRADARDRLVSAQPTTRPLACWACRELLAVRAANSKLVLEADAVVAKLAGVPAIVCRCGAVTLLPADN